MRWSDQDAYRHINNVTFLRYLEEARVDWMFHGAEVTDRRPHEGLLVVRNEIDYKRQLDYRQTPVPIELWVSKVGNASFTCAYEIVDTDATGGRTVYARAKTVLACVDMQAGHPLRLSPDRKAYLQAFLDG